ncbi:GNAT family N-acetyltransferase [Candidatus Desulfarcum epimagneticum]|uniref:GNAT family N-acetyltransferase n=1 Tax=uncultured Desulfobacteraceae bacterium TaxID=218296 RepID=A0A484HDR5_9BACT|nr:GNAT family N-acetyltransferase [uncultured Desulfobacteraceae bacterium]
MDRIDIRKLRLEDAGEIADIHEKIVRRPRETDFVQIVRQAKKTGDASFVAHLEGKIVGYMIAYVLAGGFGLKQSVWIANLGVMPDRMGQGIGEALAEKIFEYSRQNHIMDVYTSVRWDTPDLLSFFKTLDFSQSNFINLIKRI